MKVLHDVHNHSLLSQCTYDPVATVENFVKRAEELGHTVFGISNHLWDEKVPGASGWYQKQMINYGLEARNSIPKEHGDMKVLIGTECEYCGMTDTLGILAETGARFDYVLIPHTHMHMKNFVISETEAVKNYRAAIAEEIAKHFPQLNAGQVKKMANSLNNADIEALIGTTNEEIIAYNSKFMVDSFMSLMNNPEFRKLCATVPTSVAHPFHPCGFGIDMKNAIQNAVSDEDYIMCLEEAKKVGANIEINTSAYTSRENDYEKEGTIRIMKLAKKLGCTFTVGTDSHTLKDLGDIRAGDDITRICGITESDLAEYVK